MAINSIACDIAGAVARIEAPEGSAVRAGEPILVVEGEGATTRLDAPVAGRVTRLFFKQGETIPEAAIVAQIES